MKIQNYKQNGKLVENTEGLIYFRNIEEENNGIQIDNTEFYLSINQKLEIK